MSEEERREWLEGLVAGDWVSVRSEKTGRTCLGQVEETNENGPWITVVTDGNLKCHWTFNVSDGRGLMHPNDHIEPIPTKPEYEGRIERLRVDKANLINCLKEILTMQCETASGGLDSMGDSAYAEALRLLADMGEVEIADHSNRCVIGRWKG